MRAVKVAVLTIAIAQRKMHEVRALIVDFHDHGAWAAQIAWNLQLFILGVAHAQTGAAQVAHTAAHQCLFLADLRAKGDQVGHGEHAGDRSQPPSPATNYDAEGHREHHSHGQPQQGALTSLVARCRLFLFRYRIPATAAQTTLGKFDLVLGQVSIQAGFVCFRGRC